MFGQWYGSTYTGAWWGGAAVIPPVQPPIFYGGNAISIPVSRLERLKLQRDDELIAFIAATSASLGILDS